MKKFIFNSITKKYNNKIVLYNISSVIKEGITGILGANGSGKTTLIRILAGLLPADSSEYFFNDKKIKLNSQFWRERIGYLPQSPSLYERMTVMEYLDYMLLLSGWTKKVKRIDRIENVIQQLNLEYYKNYPIGHLSGGTKQRAAIGQAIIHDPEVLFLDEPTNNLDAEERNRFQNQLIADFNDKIILYIGHVINELAVICSKIIVLANGKIQFYDTPEKLIQLMEGKVKDLRLTAKEFDKKFKNRLKILRINQNEGHQIIRYDPSFYDVPEGECVKPTLEDAYQVFLNSLCSTSILNK